MIGITLLAIFLIFICFAIIIVRKAHIEHYKQESMVAKKGKKKIKFDTQPVKIKLFITGAVCVVMAMIIITVDSLDSTKPPPPQIEEQLPIEPVTTEPDQHTEMVIYEDSAIIQITENIPSMIFIIIGVTIVFNLLILFRGFIRY